MISLPRISIVLSTFNRCQTLVRVLDHLNNQNLPGSQFEVIVSDDGSKDRTKEIVYNISSRVDFHLIYERHANHGPGFTHNAGIRQASASIILLLADDVLLEPDAISTHLQAHTEHPDSNCAILGYVQQSLELDQTVFLRHWDPHRCLGDLQDHAEIPSTFFWANNISFKRNFVLSNGLFQEIPGRGGPAAHEDVELGCRLAHHGLRIFHYKDAFGYHFHNETLDSALQRSYERGYNWHDFAVAVSEQDIAVRYKVYDKHMLLNHLHVLLRFGRSPALMHKDFSFLMFLKKMVYPLLFNRWSVPVFWIPTFEYAEKQPVIAALMHDNFYKGVVHFYFHKGICDEQQGTNSIRLQKNKASDYGD